VKAIVLERFGEPAEVLTVQETSKPEPGPGEVRVRMLASPINPSDLMTVRGRYGRLPQLPATPGFEGVGVVDQAAPGLVAFLRRLKPGKKVAVLNNRGGNWQEYVVLPARNLVPLGDMPDAQGATFFVNPATAIIMTQRVLKVPRGAWLLQTAAGSALGRMVQRLGGTHDFRVINVVRREELAEAMRATGQIAISGPVMTVPDQVRKLTNGHGVGYAIDAVGGETAAAAAGALGPRGRLLLYGTLANEPISLDPRTLIANQASVEGFWLSEWIKEQSVFTMLGLFRQIKGLLRAGVLTTEVEEFPLDRIHDAARQAEAIGRTKKVLLRIGTVSGAA
jgi:NADPH:quinone reductase-like Zn-dependent oxidoreductase